MHKYLYIGWVLLLTCFNTNAQTDTAWSAFRLPPLAALTEEAINSSPQVKYQQSIILRDKANIKERKKRWMNKVFMDAGYSYTNNFSVTNINSNTGNVETLALKNGGNYRAGFTLRFSLFDFSGAKHVTQAAIQEKNASENQLLSIEREIVWQVTELYKNLELAQTLLHIKSEKMQTLALQRQVAEKEFTQGQIKIAELSRIIELTSNAHQEFEQGKNSYEKAYLKLEQFVGKPLNSF
ncbi:TolC family protein [uncultured Microscilla sp.]|uniref:TolC family protein n=1 Tax=uncultured Microscilla sp. TaxID=432653 RepID=UPI00261FECA6|nr:TolC family protein [uncultured Microscilla sp.]